MYWLAGKVGGCFFGSARCPEGHLGILKIRPWRLDLKPGSSFLFWPGEWNFGSSSSESDSELSELSELSDE